MSALHSLGLRLSSCWAAAGGHDCHSEDPSYQLGQSPFEGLHASWVTPQVLDLAINSACSTEYFCIDLRVQSKALSNQTQADNIESVSSSCLLRQSAPFICPDLLAGPGNGAPLARKLAQAQDPTGNAGCRCWHDFESSVAIHNTAAVLCLHSDHM